MPTHLSIISAGGLAMLIGRFFMMIPVLALAGSLVQKKYVPPTSGTFPTQWLAICRFINQRNFNSRCTDIFPGS